MKQFLNKRYLGLFAALLLTVMAYLTCLPGTFVYDDFDYILGNHVVAGPDVSFGEVFTSSYPPHHPEQNLYRPVVTLSYIFDKALYGFPEKPLTDPAIGFHMTNVILHLLSVWLLYSLLLKLPPVSTARQGPTIAAICAALFGVHPITTESVSWVVGRAEIMASLFCLLSLLFFLKGIKNISKGFPFVFGAWLTFVIALFSKENAIMLPALVLLLLWWLSRYEKIQWTKIWIAPAGYFLLAALYYTSRTHVFASIPLEEQAYTGLVDPVTRVLIACKVLVRYLWLIILPYGQSIFHDVEVERLIGSFAAVLLVALGVASLLMRKKAPWLFFAWAFFFLAILPVSNLLLPIGSVMAERFLYFPLMGLCMALAFLMASYRRVPWIFMMILCVLLIHHTVKTAIRNLDWRNEINLWQSAQRVYPDSFIIQAQKGYALAASGHAREGYTALAQSRKLLESQPEIFRQRFGLRLERKMTQIAGELSTSPDSPQLQTIHEVARAGNLREATLLYAAYLDQYPGSVPAYTSMIDCLMGLNAFEEASIELQKLLRIAPEEASLYGKLGFCYAQMSKFSLARANYHKALEINPVDPLTLANLGILEMREENYQLALIYFRQASGLLPQNPDFLYNEAACEAALGNADTARTLLRKLIKTHPEYSPAKKLLKTLNQ